MIDIENIAKLARLDLTKEEKAKFAQELASILGYVEKLKEIDTAKIEPTAQVTGLVNITREDLVEPSDKKTREDILGQAPERSGDFIQVKSIF